MPEVLLTVPCHNEERRLRPDGFEPIVASGMGIVFVDDGSTDDTGAILEEARRRWSPQVEVLALPENRGKAEAVRQGLLASLQRGARVVGFLDADLATPATEMVRIVEALEARGAAVALGSRVQLLGTDIRRNSVRHYLGRVFATAASLALRLPVYDTQCGAKAFRRGPALWAALARPFASRWAFDVELIGRLLAPPDNVPAVPQHGFIELPLATWSDVGGSKLSPLQMVQAASDLLAIAGRLRSER